MDQMKVGNLLKELRRKKNLTQEQLAEEFGVSRRTVSRWETGSNLPDIDILIEMSDFYGVDLRDLLDGERKDDCMDQTKEIVLKAEEYANAGREKAAKTVLVLFIAGIAALIANQAMNLMTLPETFWTGFAKGVTAGIAFGTMIVGILYSTGCITKVMETKARIRSKLERK